MDGSPSTGDVRAAHVVVTGPMGAGKTTLAAIVADRLSWSLRDSDADLERLVGVTGAELAATDGVGALHRLEAALLIGALAEDRPSVVAAAASVVDDPLARRVLERRAFVVVLTGPVEELHVRATTGAHRRQIPVDDYRALVDRRAATSDAVADLVVDARRSPDELATEVLAALASSGVSES